MPLPALPDDDPEIDPSVRQAAAQRSTWVSVVVNLLLSAGQLTAGLLAHSQALVADALHSLSDLLSDFVVLIANRHSGKVADEDHHYGHHRYENAASLVIGVLLLGVAAGMLWAGVNKLAAPHAIATVQPLALWVAGIALLAKEGLFRYMLAVAKRVRSSLLVANAWHARSDAASSLVVLAGIGGSLAGYPILDPIAALIVGLMILRMGWRFTWDALHDLMDRSASEEDNRRIEALIRATPGVHGLHDLRTRRVGDMILVDVHIEVDEALNVRVGHDIALAARKAVMDALPVLNVMTHVDPVKVP
ncbi:cobalt transporter [beta proteobacterium AAP99]|nr:cobalt transporter [beta proteobacterium AAP99]